MNGFFSRENFPTLRAFARALISVPKYMWRGTAWTFRKTYKFTLGTLVVLLIVHSVAAVVNGRRLEAALNEIKAKGQPVSMVELGLPKVADEENAAVIYAKAFEAMEALKSSDGHRNNALDDFSIAKDRAEDPELWNSARLELKRYEKVFALAEEAASRPKCQFPVNWEDGAGVMFPHLAKVRRLAQVLCADALVKARDGKMDEAIRSLETAFRMSDSISAERTFISQLVRIAVIVITTNSLRQVIAEGNISEAQANHLYRLMADMELSTDYVRAMEGERTFGISMFDYARRNLSVMSDPGCFIPQSRPHIGWKLLEQIWRPTSYADEMCYLRFMDMTIELSARPYRESQPELAALSEGSDFPRWAIMSRIVTPVFSRARARLDDARAELDGSRIVLALKVHKNRHGSYPETLDQLREKVGWEIPADVFSGKDFVYRREGNGFLLYSIGRDLKDDGAEIATEPTPDEPADYTSWKGARVRDIIWRFDR